MKSWKQILVTHPEIIAFLDKFFVCIREGDVQEVYEMLSPNLKIIACEKRYSGKFQKAFPFGQKFVGFDINELIELPRAIEVIVFAALKPMDSKSNESVPNDKLLSCIYQFRFIDIDGQWYVDDVFLNNEYQSIRRQMELN